jgi:hypothetical protein
VLGCLVCRAEEWAIKAENGTVSKPDPDKPKTWSDIVASWKTLMAQINETRLNKQLCAEWLPRNVEVGIDIPLNGEVDQYSAHTPEQKLVEYLILWKRKNFGYMSKCISLENDQYKISPKKVRSLLEDKHLISFALTSLEDFAPASTDIEVTLEFEENGKRIQKLKRFRLTNMDIDGHALPRNKTYEWFLVC